MYFLVYNIDRLLEMEIITLPKTSFSVTELQDKFNNGMLKDNLLDAALIYVQQYFYETKNGMYYFYDADKDAFEFKTDKDFKKEVVDKIDDKNFTSKLKKNDKIYQVVSEIGKPRIYQIKEGKYTKHFINEPGAFLHQKYKKFDEYSEKTKKAVYKFLDMMKELSSLVYRTAQNLICNAYFTLILPNPRSYFDNSKF
jgi:hypothetical protein